MAGTVSIISSPTPRMVERRHEFPNFDFTVGGLTSPPSNWTKTGADVFIAAEHVTIRFPRGSGFTIRTAKSTSVAASIIINTEFSIAGLAALNEPYIAMAAVYPVGPTQPKLDLWVFTYDAAGVSQQAFAPAELTSGWTIGAWNFIQMVFVPTDPDITKFKMFLYDNTQATEDVYWAYPHFGRLFDLERKFTDYDWRETANVSLAIGSDTYEIVKEGEPLLNLKFGWNDLGIVDGSNTDIAWKRWWTYAARKNVFSFWKDATKWQNNEDHFMKCISRQTLESDFKAGGVTTYRSVHTAWVPEETRIQPISRQ